ncbi:LacI family DNA-binding transcriptional regulator [Levilactobacillus namurensis]|uniref:LacI family DNA-binding transcriptional regulator n=1 Tax=Levilactobacillus namurensis TaxID=380393 RepID=UPI000463AEF4|nr:LacI family DNA-binding transcriptional regulator [Levilactobacillus namurensis]
MANTIKEVAEKAHVSPTTVSRVINNRGYISEKTKQNVFNAMKELNYYPNSVARSLIGKKMGLIGLIFPRISNVFYAELIEIIETKLFKLDYKVILCNSFDNLDKENDYLGMLQENKVDGIITGSHNKNIDTYRQINLPIVAFDRYLGNRIPVVSSDNFQGGQLIGKYLVNEDVKTVTSFAVDTADVAPTHDRISGLEAFLSEHQEIDYHLINLPSNASKISRRLLIDKALSTYHPDAIVASDDVMAMNINTDFHDYIEKHAVKIVGYDGTDLVQTMMPTLNTVVQPIPDIANLLVNLLIDKIDETHLYDSKQYILPVKFQQSTR